MLQPPSVLTLLPWPQLQSTPWEGLHTPLVLRTPCSHSRILTEPDTTPSRCPNNQMPDYWCFTGKKIGITKCYNNVKSSTYYNMWNTRTYTGRNSYIYFCQFQTLKNKFQPYLERVHESTKEGGEPSLLWHCGQLPSQSWRWRQYCIYFHRNLKRDTYNNTVRSALPRNQKNIYLVTINLIFDCHLEDGCARVF